ncbi:DUF2029 domain-containing protein [bacterium]|nr:DUF2029 domain-containing protein [bacterium]
MSEPLAKTAPSVSVLRRLPVQLGVTGFISWWLYVGVVWLSRDFAYGTPGIDRPLLGVMAMFGGVFLLYLLQVWLVQRATARCYCRQTVDERRQIVDRHQDDHALASGATDGSLPVVVVFALAFRLLLLFSEPIQEVDAYRYLWDGQSVAAGVNPFRYSPQQVLDVNANADLPADLNRLVELRDNSAAHAEILRRVHFGELTTVYPPVSQAVFALAALMTPASETVHAHLLVMKSLIVLFDLATFGMLVLLLRFVNRPAEWSIIYAWCPLLMKEFANSGHLDSIAVFVTTAAIYCAVRGLFPSPANQRPRTTNWLLAASLLLGLGVGAKIYPAIFAPLLIVSTWHRVGFRTAAAGAVVFAGVSAVMILPMLTRDQSDIDAGAYGSGLPQTTDSHLVASNRRQQRKRSDRPTNSSLPSFPSVETSGDFTRQKDVAFPDEPRLPETAILMGSEPRPEVDVPPVPPPPERIASGPQIDPTSTGLSAFALQWQMNDFLFLLLFENLTPDRGPDSSRRAWFVVTPSDWREAFVETISTRTGLTRQRVPFLVTRLMTTAIFGALAVWWAWRAATSTSATNWLMLLFLTVAWFWLLQPTQNPWYWAWALPLVPFARSRAWLLLSGLTLIYYLRFWCLYHAPETPLFGTRYSGIDFFDFVGSWIEFAPWFLALVLDDCVPPQ